MSDWIGNSDLRIGAPLLVPFPQVPQYPGWRVGRKGPEITLWHKGLLLLGNGLLWGTYVSGGTRGSGREWAGRKVIKWFRVLQENGRVSEVGMGVKCWWIRRI